MNYNDLKDPFTKKKLIKRRRSLVVEGTNSSYPLVADVPRFSDQGYSKNFGFQWKLFDKTQLDNKKNNISEVRFFATTGWSKDCLKNKRVLEVGSGAGRFTKVVLDNFECYLSTIDYSDAVEVNYLNNIKNHKNRCKTVIAQASIYEMPFQRGFFDKVFCFGVLQHTPDFEKSIEALVSSAKIGGEIVVDFYPINGWWTKLHSKYILRPFIKRIEVEKLFRLIDRHIDKMLIMFDFLVKIKLGVLTRFLPIADLRSLSKYLDENQRRELAVLDTLDMLAPTYVNPQKNSTVCGWFEKYGAEVSFSGSVKHQYGFTNTIRAIRRK